MTKIASLVHSSNATDETLVGEELEYTMKHSSVQVVAELIEALRVANLSWWSPAFLREQKTPTDRMRALASRPDLRYEITVKLTGLSGKSARKRDPDFQASLFDHALDEGDRTDTEFEEAFPSSVLAVYLDPASYWKLIRQQMPWGDNSEAHQTIMEFALDSFLKPRESGTVLHPHDVITSINRLTWVESITPDVHAEVTAALLSRGADEPGSGHDIAKHIIKIATPKVIAKYVKPSDLISVFDAAEKALGFEPPAPEIQTEPSVSPDATTEPPEDAPTNGSTIMDEKSPFSGEMVLSPKS